MEKIVKFKGLEFEVGFDFQPEEKQTKDYPGCHAAIEGIWKIEHKGSDFLEILGDDDAFEKAIWDSL